jgi:hypothetical protein
MMACSADARPADYAAVLARIDALPAPKARPSRTFQASDAGISHDQATDEVSLAATVGVLPSAAAADAEAAESAPREKKGPRIHVGRVALLAAIAAVLISAWAWIFHDRVSSDPVVDPPYFPSDWVEPLFDGVSIGGWAVRRGGWAPGLDSEGGIVLEGSGTIARPLPQKDGAALTHYQLTLGVNLHEAEAVEVHFGVPASAGADQAHLVIRMTRDEAALGRRSGRDRDFESTSAPIDLPPEDGGATEHYHALRVERQSKQWDVYCDERKVGAVPIADRSERAEFWLVTEGGEARFENLEVRELLPIDVQPNRFAPR